MKRYIWKIDAYIKENENEALEYSKYAIMKSKIYLRRLNDYHAAIELAEDVLAQDSTQYECFVILQEAFEKQAFELNQKKFNNVERAIIVSHSLHYLLRVPESHYGYHEIKRKIDRYKGYLISSEELLSSKNSKCKSVDSEILCHIEYGINKEVKMMIRKK